MPQYDIEIGDNSVPSVCHCCNNESCTGHGFVYKNDDAYAVYYAGWSVSHSEKRISFALAIGEWGDDSTNDDRTCFGFEAWEGEEEILFQVIGPDESPWPDTDLLGGMLSRKDSFEHSLLKEVFVIAEIVVRNHPAIQEYLGIPVGLSS